MMALPENFASRLKFMRESFRDDEHVDRGMSIRELAKRTGIHFTLIAAYEAGRRAASVESLQKLARVFGLSGSDAESFVAEGREDARISKIQQQFPFLPNAAIKCLLDEISMAARNTSGAAVQEMIHDPECDLMWRTDNDEWFAVEVMTVAGKSRTEALRKLRQKIRLKADRASESPSVSS